jgi:hypothetical protein
MLKFKKILGLGLLVAAMSMFTASCVEDDDEKFDGDAYVRFVWERSWQPYMYYISASFNDVEDWYEQVWNDPGIVNDDFVYRPTFNPQTMSGIPGLPSIFTMQNNTSVHANNGREFRVAPGRYIAVCSVNDPDFDDTIWEIIADYTISVDHAVDPYDRFFEIGFWLTDFFSENPQNTQGNPDGLSWGWYGHEYDDGDAPRLSKRGTRAPRIATQKIKKGGATMDVTFYAFPRTKK